MTVRRSQLECRRQSPYVTRIMKYMLAYVRIYNLNISPKDAHLGRPCHSLDEVMAECQKVRTGM